MTDDEAGTAAAVNALFDAAARAEELLRQSAVGDMWEASSVVDRMTVGDIGGHLFLALRHGLRTLQRPIPGGNQIFVPPSAWYGHARLSDDADLDRSVHVKIRADGNHVGERGWRNVVDRFAALRAEMLERTDLA